MGNYLGLDNHFLTPTDVVHFAEKGKYKSLADVIRFQAEKAIEEKEDFVGTIKYSLTLIGETLFSLRNMSGHEIEVTFIEAQKTEADKNSDAYSEVEALMKPHKHILDQVELVKDLPGMEQIYRYLKSDYKFREGGLRLRDQGVCLLPEKTPKEYHDNRLNAALESQVNLERALVNHQNSIKLIKAQRDKLLAELPIECFRECEGPFKP